MYRRDPRQEMTVRALQGVWEGVAGAVAAGALPGASGGGASSSAPRTSPRRSGMTMFEAMDEAPPPRGGGWLSSFFGGGNDDEGTAGSSSSSTHAPPGIPTGLYMHGGVGTGKTMLMDLFVEAVGGVAPVSYFMDEGAGGGRKAQLGGFISMSIFFLPAMTRRHLKNYNCCSI